MSSWTAQSPAGCTVDYLPAEEVRFDVPKPAVSGVLLLAVVQQGRQQRLLLLWLIIHCVLPTAY